MKPYEAGLRRTIRRVYLRREKGTLMIGAIMVISIILFIAMVIFGFVAWVYDLLHCKPHSELGQRILRLDENNNPIEDKKK